MADAVHDILVAASVAIATAAVTGYWAWKQSRLSNTTDRERLASEEITAALTRCEQCWTRLEAMTVRCEAEHDARVTAEASLVAVREQLRMSDVVAADAHQRAVDAAHEQAVAEGQAITYAMRLRDLGEPI